MSGFDVVVVGGGHAGCEAAAAAARIGARTLLLTQRLDTIGTMSCNPAIGGIGKGHLVREIDALDGIMGRAADLAGIHFKMLNRSKGPAVWGPRAQADRQLYRRAVMTLLRAIPGLELREGVAADIEFGCDQRVRALWCGDGSRIRCAAAVITTGTFLRGMIHVGAERTPAGRLGEPPESALCAVFERLGVTLRTLKTGTPPRLDRASLDWDGLECDHGDTVPEPFSTLTARLVHSQVACRITGTTPATHDIVRAHLGESAAYSGAITGTGPRYCPSLEDKVVRFASRSRHQVFLEPEGLASRIVYPNGLSTSLPVHIQAQVIHSIPGMERARILRPGYAVAYTIVDPRSLEPTLGVRGTRGLFLAGQINGTTGYEEAAAQGVLAGANAARHSGGGLGVTLSRSEAYIGVLVDDLVTQGALEPYRMFTSRAEFRLSLRADNADLRLTPIGSRWGVVRSCRATIFGSFEAAVRLALERARSTVVPGRWRDGRVRTVFDLVGDQAVPRSDLIEVAPWLGSLPPRVTAQLESESVYAGYLGRQAADAQLANRDAHLALGSHVVYETVQGLSRELRDKLTNSRPPTLEAAARVSGMTPAGLSAIVRHMRGFSPEPTSA